MSNPIFRHGSEPESATSIEPIPHSTITLPRMVGVPEFVQSWIRSLLDPTTIELLRHAHELKVDVTLHAHRGQESRAPTITIAR